MVVVRVRAGIGAVTEMLVVVVGIVTLLVVGAQVGDPWPDWKPSSGFMQLSSSFQPFIIISPPVYSCHYNSFVYATAVMTILAPFQISSKINVIYSVIYIVLLAVIPLRDLLSPHHNYTVHRIIELELELIQTQMTQKPMLRAEVGMRVRCANKASGE